MQNRDVMNGVLRYVGDISRADAAVLASFARSSRRILEFGAGASTQVFTQVAAAGTRIVSLERDPYWIERTRLVLGELAPDNRTELVKLDRLGELDIYEDGAFDLILDDGEDDLRLEFGLAAWRLLQVGGRFLLHDTRRRRDIANALMLAHRFFREVERIDVNVSGSNLTVIHKCSEKPYENWNRTEARESWEVGDDPIELTLQRLRTEAE